MLVAASPVAERRVPPSRCTRSWPGRETRAACASWFTLAVALLSFLLVVSVAADAGDGGARRVGALRASLAALREGPVSARRLGARRSASSTKVAGGVAALAEELEARAEGARERLTGELGER